MERVYHYLPEELACSLQGLPGDLKKEICEIRLRKNAPLSVSTYRKNLLISKSGHIALKMKDSVVCTSNHLITAVNRFCQGSVYRYMPTINSGFIVTPEGVRVGVCGECIYDGGRITSVSAFTSVNVRLSRNIERAGDLLSRYIVKNQGRSVLIVSPPGYGKTTVIRSVAKALGNGSFSAPMRVAVIDERGEILPEGATGLIDRFLGYSKPHGIEIAVRLFTPEYIICDEIGLFDDTQAILSVQNSGVPFVATTHGRCLSEVLKRPNIKALIDYNIFDTFVRLEKGEEGVVCIFEELLV